MNRSELNEEIRADLRRHHFKFGYGTVPKEDKISNYMKEYVPKEVPKGIRDEFLDAKEKARASVSAKIKKKWSRLNF